MNLACMGTLKILLDSLRLLLGSLLSGFSVVSIVGRKSDQVENAS